MPLPLVLGGKSVSAQTLPGPVGRPDESDDGTLLEPLVLYQTLGWGVCTQGEWLVRVTCSYYDLIDPSTGTRNCTMVEVRIQLSPLTRPLSLDYRETAHHLKLYDGAQDHYPQSQPQVVVSTDRKNLAVLLFHPHQQSSALVIFQLRKPRTDLSSAPSTNPIPLPTYIQKVGNEDSNDATIITRDPPAIASHPRFVSVWGISTVCCLPPNVNPSVFVAACQDGSLVWLDARSSMAVATGRLDLTPQQRNEWLPFSTIRAAPCSEMNLGQVLIVTSNGKALLVHWNLESTTKVQQTFLKRASTGTVVTESNLPSSQPLRNHSFQVPKQVHVIPARSKSSELTDAVFSPKRMQNLFRRPRPVSTAQAPLDLKPQLVDEETSPKRLDVMVLKELQKKTLSAASTTIGSSNTKTTPNGPSPLLQKVQQEQLHRQIEQQQRRRRRSELEGISAVDTLKRQMKLRILSWVGEYIVVDACFGNLPTIVCLLYQANIATRRVAQIYSICEGGTFQPLLNLTLSNEQLQEAFKLHSSRDNGKATTAKSPNEMALQSRKGLDHDPSSDTFAISTTYEEETDDETKNRWVGCLWNWRCNALSWTIQQALANSTWSRLYFAKHPQQANHLAFLQCHQDKYLHVRKQVVATGLLSPPSWQEGGECSLEPNSLLLTSDSVFFPQVSQPSSSDILELDWRVSTLPLHYRNMYGPPKIAISGRQHGNSIAIASSNGVCVLDRYYKWKQFGTPSEERSFQVVAMTWWEGHPDAVGLEEVTEDLLVAIIQSNNGRQYLSCWSPKRLDLAHQLLETPNYHPAKNDDGSTEFSWGVPLAKAVKASSLTILGEPYVSPSENRRAVVLVSSTNPGTCDMDYSCYRLQVCKVETNIPLADSYHELKPYCVITKEAIHGPLKNGARSVGPISSVFLAGASFDFDLLSSSKNSEDDEDEMIVTLGIVRSPGGIEAVNLTGTNKAFISSILDDNEVSKICLADIMGCNNANPYNGRNVLINAFVWTIELLNGHLYCWTVPYKLRGRKGMDMHLPLFFRDERMARPKGLCPPHLVCTKESREKRIRYNLGIICHIGRSSDWMQQSSSGTQSDISLGLVPDSGFGCVLRAGQDARTLHRSGIGGDFDTDLFASDFLESEVYGPSEFLMMPPVFVPSLYMLLLEAAFLRTQPKLETGSELDSTSNLFEDEKARLEFIQTHIDCRLKACQNKDAAMMALRLLILRAVEQLSHVDKKHRKAQSDASLSNLILSLALFTEIVDVVRRCTTNLQFASLFLEVGRQIEPGFLAHLFPLPQSHSESPKQSETSKRRKSRACLTDKSLVDRFNARTVDDLFSLCIHEGSLAASASALPLLSRMQSRSYCDLLLERAITAFVHNIDSTDATFDRTQEERRVIGDLFRFGVKLEDAEALEGNMLAQEFHEESLKEAREKLIAEGTAVQTVTNGNFGSVDDGAAYSTDDDDSRCYGQNASNRNLICVGGGKRESFILNYMIHSIFDDGNKVSEEAIRRAASSFIESKQDLVSMDFLTLGADDASGTADTDDGNDDYWSNSDSGVSRDPNASKHIGKPGKNIKSVATLVGDVMHELLKAPKIDHPWKAMSSLARLIVQHSNDLPPLDVFTTAMQQTRKSTLEAVLPSGYETEESSDQLVRFLVAEIGRCEFQIESSVQEPAWVVDLALILLQRLLSDSKCSEELLSSLVLIALIAGHVSGRAEELLEPIHDTPSYLVNCYKTAHLNTCTI